MAEIESIRCMQLPMLNLQLLMPNSAVAEIIGYVQPSEEFAGSGWYDGLITWRGALVPVVSLEQMCQQESEQPGPRCRIAIVYNPSGDDDLPYVGLILQDIPRAYLAEKERMHEEIDALLCQYLRARADRMVEQLVIPDLDAIMAAVKQRLNQ